MIWSQWRASWPRILGPAPLPALLLGLLAGCGGGGGSTPVVPPVGEPPAPREEVLAASKPGELLAYVKDKLKARQAQRVAVPGTPEFVFSAGAPSLAAATTSSSGVVSRTGTTVQEAGVDEDDLLKTDGNLLASLVLQPQAGKGGPYAQLRLHRRVAGGGLGDAVKFDLQAPADETGNAHGLLLAPDAKRAVVVGESFAGGNPFIGCPPGEQEVCLLPYRPEPTRTSVLVQTVNMADPANPTLAERLAIDGRLVGTRLVGNTLYLVTSYSPSFPVEALPASATTTERDAALAATSLDNLLPKARSGAAAPQPVVRDTDCYTQAKNASLDLQVTTLIAIDLASPTLQRASRCFVGGTEALYVSTGSIYLATTRQEVQILQTLIRYDPESFTDLHKFSIAGLAINYRASGTVRGHLGWDRAKASYRMSEHNGDLRVLSFTGSIGWAVPADAGDPAKPASPATLTVLRERASDATLQVVSTLPNATRTAPLGQPGEQVYAVRFLGDKAYVVTFRQVDPLIVLDLANPADPRSVGELKIPGISDWLYPLDNGLLLGVGRDADASGRLGGVKVALFDVADPAQPRELATRVWGGRGSSSGLDYSAHGFNLQAVGSTTRAALPLMLFDETAGRFTTGLQRLQVDTTARRLDVLPLITTASTFADISGDRSLQIGDQLYHLSRGSLSVRGWAE